MLNDPPEKPEELSGPAWQPLARALAKKAADRFSSCSAFADALAGRTGGNGEGMEPYAHRGLRDGLQRPWSLSASAFRNSLARRKCKRHAHASAATIVPEDKNPSSPAITPAAAEATLKLPRAGHWRERV